MDSGIFQRYPQLMQLQTNWAPFIARLAYHAADVFDAKNIPLLREMSAITWNLTVGTFARVKLRIVSEIAEIPRRNPFALTVAWHLLSFNTNHVTE